MKPKSHTCFECHGHARGYLQKKTYKKPLVKFSQDMRFCRYNCGKEEFYQNNLSNNQLIVKDKKIREKVKQIRVSDQICISGQLVKLSADLLKGGGTYKET